MTMYTVNLGAEFPEKVRVPDESKPAFDPGIMLLMELRDILRGLPEVIASKVSAIETPPVQPVVHVSEPDLSAIVTAVNGIKPGANADDIGKSIARHLNPDQGSERTVFLQAFEELANKIDFRLQGVGRAFGSSGPSNIADNANRQLGIVSITGTLPQLPLAANPLTGQTTVAVASTAVQLPNEVLINGLVVQALAGNVGKVYVGASGVTSGTGFELQAGQAASAGIVNANTMWVVGPNVGDGVCFIGS
jgi:hypothetical protein